jgi:thiol:disulfide interchange protein
MESPTHPQGQPVQPGEDILRERSSRTPLRRWLWRLLFLAVWIGAYSALPDPLDAWLGIATLLAFGVWLYTRVSDRLKLPPLKFEKSETITLTHILLALLLVVMLANHVELVNLKKATMDVQSSLTDLQNSGSDNTEEIKSSLDDVKNAIEASQ